jgi:L-malate glycosyltransferase
MRIGVYLENYRAGGLDRVMIDTLNHWPFHEDVFVIYCNDNHQGLPFLRQQLAVTVEWRIYSAPAYMRQSVWSARWRQEGARIFYNVVGCYWHMLFDIPRLRKIFQSDQLQALMVHNGGWPAARTTRSAIIAGYLAGIPKLLMIVHGVMNRYHWANRFQEMTLSRYLRSIPLQVVGVSRAVCKGLDRAGLPLCQPILNGVCRVSIRAEATSLRTELTLSNADYVLGVFGTLEWYRGHQVLLEMLHQLRQSIANPVVLLVGTGTLQERARIQEKIDLLGLGSYVRLLGFRQDVPALMSLCDVVVNPVLTSESFSLVAVEAMSLKIPVIASRVGGLPEVIEDGESGYLVPVGDVSALVDKCLVLYAQPHLRGQMAEAGYRRYRRLFTAPRMATNYQTLCQCLEE